MVLPVYLARMTSRATDGAYRCVAVCIYITVQLIGVLLIILGQAIQAAQMVVEEHVSVIVM